MQLRGEKIIKDLSEAGRLRELKGQLSFLISMNY